MAVDQETLNRWKNAGAASTRAYDGDSPRGSDGRTDRLRTANAPEKAGDDIPVDMPGSVPATEALQQALDSGAQVESFGAKGYYGRDLVDVEDHQGNVGNDMVARGLAAPTEDSMNFMHLGVYDEATGQRRRPEWDKYADQADRENLDFLRGRFEALLDQSLDNYTPGVNNREGVGAAAGAAWHRGVNNLQGSLFGFAEVIGEATGVDSMAEWGEDGLLRNMTQAAMHPARIANYEEAYAGGFEGVGLYVMETLIENAPQLGVDIAAAVGTGGGSALLAGVGKAALRKIGGSTALGKAGTVAKKAYEKKGLLTGRSGTVGMGASMEAQLVGETRQQQYAEGLEDEDDALMMAGTLGTAKMGLELASLQTILRSVMKGGSKDAAKELADTMREAGSLVRLRDVAAKATQTGGLGFMAEGTTEMLQQFMDELGTMELDPNREINLEEIDLVQMVDAGLRGGIFGGTLGTAGGTVSGIAGMRQNARAENLNRQQAENSFEGTAPEPTDNLKGQGEIRGAVWLSPSQSEGDKEDVRSELAKQGEVYERTNDEGSTYLTIDPNDPLLSEDTEMTGDNLTRSKGFVPKSELDPEAPQQVVTARDDQGREIEAITTDEANLEQTLGQMNELYPELLIQTESAEGVLADRQTRREDLETQRLGQLPPSKARDDQDARSRKAAEAERNKNPVYVNGQVRPIGELVADYKSGRLNQEALVEALDQHGIDIDQFREAKVPVDRDRTLEALRRKLASNKALAAKYAGVEDADTVKNTSVFQLADWAVQSLASGGTRQLRQAVKDVGIEFRRDEGLDGDGRRRLMPRIKSRLKGKLPRAVAERATRRFVGEGASLETLIDQLDDMSDNDLVGLAEVLGADTKGLTKPGKATEDDVLGMFQALGDRAKRARPLSEAELEELIPIGPSRSAQVNTDGRVTDSQIAEAKAARRVPTQEDRAEAESDQIDEAISRDAEGDWSFIGQAARDIGIITRLANLTGLSLDSEKLVSAYWRWHWPKSETDGSTPKAKEKADVTAALEAADPNEVQQRLRHLIRYAVAQDILNDGRIAPDDKGAALDQAFDPEQEAEQQMATGLKLLAANTPNDPEGAVIGALTEHGLLGDTATRFEGEIVNPNSRGDSAVAESFPSPQERDPQEQSDLVFYRAVYQSTLKLKENQFLESRSQHVSPHDWSEAEKDYQQIRAQFDADPAAFERDFRETYLPRLIELRAVSFVSSLSQFTAESEARARVHTDKAGGQNLIMLEYSGTTGPVFRLVDAVTLASYAKDRHPVNAAEALTNLESNLARLAQGPESAGVQRLRTNGLTQVTDDTVVWFDENGQPVTAGKAREMQKEGRKVEERTVEASQRKDQAVEELESVERLINEALDQLQQETESEDADVFKGIEAIRADLRENYWELQEERTRQEAIERKTVERQSDSLTEAEDQLAAFKERIANGTTKIPPARQKQILARQEARVEAVRKQLKLTEDAASAARVAIAAEAKARENVAELADAELGGGVIASVQHLLSQRIGLLSEIKQLNLAVTGSEIDTSLRGWQAELEADLDYRSENDIAEEGFDQEMANRDWQTMDVEADLYEEDNEFAPDPMDQAVFRGERDADLNSVEASAETEVQRLADSQSVFEYLPSVNRGLSMPLDGTLPEARRTPARKPASGPKPTKRPFAGTKVVGKAAKHQSMQALASFARRLITTVSKGMHGAQRTAFLNTPLVIVETGDIEALKQVARDADRAHYGPELGKLVARPGYLNLGPVAVISMDRLSPGMNPAEWSLVFGHELGHMIYDQSWHHMDEATKGEVIRMYTDSHGHSGYNGKDGGLGFKEWFADQMSAAIAKDVTDTRRSQYLDAQGALGKALRFVIDNLKRMWDAIQSDKTARHLRRFKLNLKFEEFAQRILTGKMPMSHRYNLAMGEVQTLHYTPDEKPLPRSGAEARMKQANKGKLKPTGIIRSVIGRIRSYSPELAGLLFQGANQARVADGSYEQKRYSMGNLWAAELQKGFDKIGKGRKQQEAVNRAYADLRDGKDTEGARILRETIDRIMADAKKRGWASGEDLGQFTPRAFNHGAVEARRGELMAMAKEALPKATDQELNEQIDRIISGFGLQELGHEPMGPGRPVGTHTGARTLMDAIGTDKLAEEGFLMDKGYGMLQHFATGLAKRAAWESTFGGYVNKDGQYSEALQKSARRLARAGEHVYYDPNVKYKQALEKIAGEHGAPAAAEVKDLVLGAMGHNNLGVKKWARVSQEWATGITNLMILGFSGVASIPELATAFIRADFGFSDIVGAIKNYGEAKRFAYDIGVAMTTGAEQAMRESLGEGYQSSGLSKANNLFFTVNGQQFITRLSRTLGTSVGMRYVLKAAAEGDYNSLQKLGLTPEVVRQWDAMGRPAYTADMQGPHAEVAQAVSDGVSQFVNEGTLNPNKFQSANWGNNPYMKVVWHLKQFLWTFGDTVIGGVARKVRQDYQQGKAEGYSAPLSALMATASPMWAMGLMMPLAALSLGLRGLLAGDDRFDEDWDELGIELMRKTGAFAQWDLVHGLWTANQWDQGPVGYAGAVVPAVSVSNQIVEIDNGKLDAGQSAKNLLGMTPLVGQFKGTWQWLLE